MKSIKLSLLLLVALLSSSCTGEVGLTGPQGPQGEVGQTGPQGEPGKDGTSLLTGEGAPSASLGNVGDSYIDTATWDYYLKTSSGWIKQGNIKGQDGEKGEDGSQGPQGEPGQTGSQGDDGLSAYEIYIKYHPEYQGDEEQWIHDLVNGNLYEPAYYTLSFDTQGGDDIDSVNIPEGEAIGDYLPASPYRDGYAFIGWSYDPLEYEKVDLFDTIEKDTTIYAFWETDEKPITITFWHTFGQYNRSLLSDLIADFELLHPNITIVPVMAGGGYDDLKSKIITGFSSGDYPDLAVCYPDHVAEYLDLGYAVNLDNCINDPTYGWTEEDMADLIPAFIEEGQGYADEGTYSVSFYKSTEAMFYNPELIGIDLSSIDADINNGNPLSEEYLDTLTWDELFNKLCPALVTYNNGLTRKIWDDTDAHSAIVGYDSDDNFFITLAEQYGYAYTSIDSDGKGKVDFNNDGMKELMKMLNNAAQKKYLTTKGAAGDYVTSLSVERKVLFSIGSTGGFIYQLPDGSPWVPNVARVPQAPTGNGHKQALMSQGPSLTVLKHMNNGVVDADRVMASWLFYKFLAETDNSTDWALNSTGGYMPIRTSSMESQAYQDAYATTGKEDLELLLARGLEYCSEVPSIMFTPKAFVGSSECRNQAGSIVQQVVAADHVLIDAELDTIFTIAYNNAVAAIK